MNVCFDDNQLERLLDESLDEREREAVEAHVEGCRSCQSALDLMIATRAAETPSVGIPGDDLIGRVKRLGKSGERTPRPESGRAWHPSGPANPVATVAEASRHWPDDVLPRIVGFRLVREIGRGGMGAVYEAIELALDRRVALKVLPRSSSIAPTAIERFRREARSAARLHHTNIVPVFGFGEDSGHLFYAMQLIDGEGLDRILARLRGQPRSALHSVPVPANESAGRRELAVTVAEGKVSIANSESRTVEMPENTEPPSTADESSWPVTIGSTTTISIRARIAARIGREVAEGLEHAHRLGVLHRDVKPSNILVDNRGTAWVADFGLAKTLDPETEDLTRTGDIVGTIRYMAPERFDGHSDARGDIYSLGVSLYELLTLRPAFEDSNRVRLIERVLREEPARPRSLDRGLPLDFETIVLKAMAKDPAARYESAAAVAEDLRLFLAGEPILARRVGPAERAWRWTRRNPMVSGLAAAVVVAVAVGFSLTFWQWRESVAQASRAVLAESNMTIQRDQAVDARKETARHEADLTLDRGLGLLDRGEWAAGLHWLGHGLESPEVSPKSSRMARLNLAAWRAACPRLVAVIGGTEPVHRFAFDGDGSTLNVLDQLGRNLRHVSISTGQDVRPSSSLARPGDAKPDRDDFLPGGQSVWAWHRQARSIEILDAATGLSRGAPVEIEPVYPALAPDGSSLAVMTGPETLSVLGVSDVKPLGPPIRATLAPDRCFAVSPGGRTLLTIGPGGGQFWDVASGRLIGTSPLMSTQSEFAVYGPTGEILILERLSVERRDRSGGRLRFWGPDGSPRGNSEPIRTVLDNTDRLVSGASGTRLAIIDGNERIAVFDRRRGSRLDIPKVGGRPQMIAFSPDESTLAVGMLDGQVRLLDAISGRLRGDPLNHPGKIVALRYDRDGRHLGVVGSDGSAWIWELPDRPMPAPSPSADFMSGWQAQIVPKLGRALILGPTLGGDRVVSLEGRPGAVTMPRAWTNGVIMAASSDGRRWATSSFDPSSLECELRLWDADGRPVGEPLSQINWIVALAFSPDGKTLAATGYAGRVWIFDAETGRSRRAPLATGRVSLSLAFSPDSKTLAVGTGPSSPPGASFQVQLWDLATGNMTLDVDQPGWTTGLYFSPDGRSLLLNRDRSLFATSYSVYEICDAKTLKPRGATLSCPTLPTAAAFFLNGDRLLTRGPGGVWEWDVASGRPTRLVISVSRPLRGLAVDPSGQWVATLDAEGEGQLHDLATGQPVGPRLRAEWPIIDLSFNQAGDAVLGALVEYGMRSWPVPKIDVTGPDLRRSLEVVTGSSFEDSTGLTTLLSAEAWRHRQWPPGERGEAGREPESKVRIEGGPARRHEDWAEATQAEGDASAALWHVDRLAEYRPGDWTILARRSRAFAELGEFDRAGEELRRASSLAPPRAVRDWQLCRAVDARALGQLPLASWYLGRILDADPGDWAALLERAEVHEAAGRGDARDADLVAASAAGMTSTLVQKLARHYGVNGRWDRATALLAAADSRPESHDEMFNYHLAIASLSAGDEASYRDACRRQLDRIRRKISGFSLNQATYLVTLGPRAVDNLGAMAEASERLLAQIPAVEKNRRHSALNTLGALRVRLGDAPAAIRTIHQGIDADGNRDMAEDYAFLALAHVALGEREPALAALRQADDLLKGSSYFWRRSEIAVLRREAEAALKKATPELPRDVFAPAATIR